MGMIVGYIPPKQVEKPAEVVKETKAEKPKKETAKKEK